MTERRADWRPDETCPWCGDERRNHDRLSDEWAACERKARWFAGQGAAA